MLTSLAQDTLNRAITHGLSGIFGPSPVGGAPWPRAPRRKGERLYAADLVREGLREPHTVESVDPTILYATQPNLTRPGVEYYLSGEYLRTGRTFADGSVGNRVPVVYVNSRGEHLILSGHHRAAAALINREPLNAIVIREDT